MNNEKRIIEYQLKWPDGTHGGTHELVFSPNGHNLWISGPAHNAIAKVTFKDMNEYNKKVRINVKYYNMPLGSAPHGLTFDYKGRLWVTLENAGLIVRVDKHGKIVEQVSVMFNGANPSPHGLTSSLDGKTLWFTGKYGSTIGKIKLCDRSVKQYLTPTANSQPIYIKPDYCGNFWFTELVGNNIGRIRPNGDIVEFPIPTANSRPIIVAPAKNKKYLWFTEELGKNIGKITMDGKITEFPVPITQPNIVLTALVIDSKSNLWIASHISQNNPTPPGPDYIIEFNKNINCASNGDISNVPITYYQIPTRNSVPHRLVQGPDGNIYFTELATDKLAIIINSCDEYSCDE